MCTRHCCSTWVGSGLTRNDINLKILPTDKHSSLFCHAMSDEESFIVLTPGSTGSRHRSGPSLASRHLRRGCRRSACRRRQPFGHHTVQKILKMMA
jgi:hypothetical protein